MQKNVRQNGCPEIIQQHTVCHTGLQADIFDGMSCSLQEEDDQPEPPKRTKQANQYFWRRHYLSIIQGTGFC
jgi:hypothetical protein